MTKPDRYQPKGGMCASCMMGIVCNCSNLPFSTMPVIERFTDDGAAVAVVRCTDYKPLKSPSHDRANCDDPDWLDVRAFVRGLDA